MKSFRLDLDSVEEVVEGWPYFLITLVIGSAVAFFATKYAWFRILVPLLLGLAIGPRIVGNLRQNYPTAKRLWVLAIGMVTCMIGVCIRTAFPSWQGMGFDLTWLGVAFFSIASFVFINRRNSDVLR